MMWSGIVSGKPKGFKETYPNFGSPDCWSRREYDDSGANLNKWAIHKSHIVDDVHQTVPELTCLKMDEPPKLSFGFPVFPGRGNLKKKNGPGHPIPICLKGRMGCDVNP